jgi:signal peptidase II
MVFITASIVLAADQLCKFLAVKNLTLGKSYPLVKGVFHLTLVYNRGAAFGILKNQLTLFILTAVFAIVLIVNSLRANAESKVYRFALSLVLGGALGNLVDRLLLGCVVDFLDFRVWPVFNLADSAITIGAAILGIAILKRK